MDVGFENGFCLGEIDWNNDTQHARPCRLDLSYPRSFLAPPCRLAPWEIGYVGAPDMAAILIEDPPASESIPEDLHVYELQPGDLGRKRIKRSARRGVFLSDDLTIPGVGEEFVSMKTNGDGGCALHATWGHPGNVQQWLELPQGQNAGRQQCYDMLGETVDAAMQKLGNWHVSEQLKLSIWSELAEHGAQRHGDEAGMFWDVLCAGQPSLADEVCMFLQRRCQH